MTSGDFGLSVIAGVVSGALTGGIFYYFAGLDLKREASRLRSVSRVLARALQDGEIAEFTWDAEGNPKGLVQSLSATMTGEGRMSGNLTKKVKTSGDLARMVDRLEEARDAGHEGPGS